MNGLTTMCRKRDQAPAALRWLRSPVTMASRARSLFVQSDISADLPSVIICPLTTTIRPELPQFRVTITPSPSNGLRVLSQVMIEKPSTVPRAKLRAVIGHLDEAEMRVVTTGLGILLAIA